jgi:hypothetical protein
MSSNREMEAFQRALHAYAAGVPEEQDSDDAELESALHPADEWTIRAVRSLSVNGSFR